MTLSLLPIVDSHVHLWNPAQFRYTWLDGVPKLNREFLPHDFAAAIEAVNVDKVIFVECGCEPAQNIAEVDWVSSLAKREPRLRGIVAQASLERGPAAREELEALAARPLVKGVRRSLQGESDPEFCLQPGFVAEVRSLAEFGYTFDLCIRHEQMRPAAELVRRVPEVTFVLDHFGKPDVRGKRTEPWTADLRTLAELPNTVCKVSGLATEADMEHWRTDDIAHYMEWTFELFGPDRLLFGGDWPVALLATNYRRWVETVRQFSGAAGEPTCIKLFRTNAERIYRV